MRTSVAATVVAVAVLALAGCTTSTPTTTVASTPAPAPSTSVATTTAPPATKTVPSTVVSTAPALSSSVPTSAKEELKTVDPNAFRDPSGVGYFFKSPSGKIECGMGSGNAKSYTIGCQIREKVPTLPDCPGDGTGIPNVAIGPDPRNTGIGCMSNGNNFHLDGAKVLQYGESLTVPGKFTCVSRESGVSCESVVPKGRFTIAKEGITLEG